jgi:hypothetical protein
VVTLKSAALRQLAPTIFATLVMGKDQWWRIGADGLTSLASLACDMAEVLDAEIDRRAEAEIAEKPEPPRPEPSDPLRRS